MSDPYKAKSTPQTHAAETDDDPAKPVDVDLAADTADWERSPMALTNYGDPEVNKEFDLTAEPSLAEDTITPTLAINIGAASDFLESCMTSSPRVTYGFGKKVSPHGAVPGSGFTKVDCSGFVREAIWRSTAPHFNFPDGSVVQHDWIRDKGYEKSTRADAMLEDGKVRIVFLRPQDSPSNIGHVALVHNARTLESHGSHGPNSRDWTNTGWQAKAFVYILKN